MPNSRVFMVVRPDTMIWYAAGVEALYDFGFSYVISTLDYSADWQEAHLPELTRQYEALGGLYERKSLADDNFALVQFDAKIGGYVSNRNYCRERCALGHQHFSVGPDGTLYPCVQFTGDRAFQLGNVYQGIDESAREALLAAIYEGKQEPSACDGCVIRARCNNDCACRNRQATGSLTKVSPMLCAHERIVLPIADRVAERLYQKGSTRFVQKHYHDFHPLT
jgi:uncharacterized protein